MTQNEKLLMRTLLSTVAKLENAYFSLNALLDIQTINEKENEILDLNNTVKSLTREVRRAFVESEESDKINKEAIEKILEIDSGVL